MPKQFRADPAEFARCVDYLCTRIATIAVRHGVDHVDCSNLEEMLAALPLQARPPASAMLNDVALKTESEDPAMAFAARYLTQLAQNVWRVPKPP